MPSRTIRPGAGFFGLVSAIILSTGVLTVPSVVCVAADKPVSVEGPALAMRPERPSTEKTTPSLESSQPDKPSKSEKKAASSRAAAKTTKSEKSAKSTTDTTKKDTVKKDTVKKDIVKKDKIEKDTVKKDESAVLGDPLASGMMELLRDEIVGGFKRRGNTSRFASFQRYAIGKVNSSAGRYTGSELAGNCRLQWYDRMMRNVLAAPAEAERFTRDVHVAARDDRQGLERLLDIASEKLDLGGRKLRPFTPPTSPEQALEMVRQAIADAQVAYCQALAPLSKAEIQELETHMVPVLVTQNQVGHTLQDRGEGRRLCDIMEKMDRGAMLTAALALAPLSDERVLEQLKGLPDDGDIKVQGVTGTIVRRIETPSGAVLIGGKDRNVYELDQLTDVVAVIDLGGNDVYYEGTVGTGRPVLVVMDLGGNDAYRGSRPGIQGGAVLGVSMLVDAAGNDVYEAQDVAQGSALAGVGILIDQKGNDRYVGVRRLQGQAIGGVGLLVDRAGKDDYKAAMWAQGFGGPLGFGLLDDMSGNDHYFCGGMWRDSYPETPGCEGWGQGVGAGLRQVANGGVGVILDGGGDDIYEFDYLAHGGGYWCALGFARDFGGNDQRLITRTAYNGGQRFEPNFQRFGNGWGCHYAQGFLFDDSGNDVYEGTIMGTGMAWDCSMGVLSDFAGNDRYKATGGSTQGTGAQMGLGILFDYNGDDVYEGYGQGYASNGISYHTLPDCGGNFSFVIDYGGNDNYGCGAQNNSYIQRGDSGGFVIDRPRRDEAPVTASSKSNGKNGS